MADILTQMQDEVDMVYAFLSLPTSTTYTPTHSLVQLLNMMQSQLFQIRTRAPPSVPTGQQRVDSFAEKEAKDRSESNPTQPADASAPAQPTHEEFAADIKDMARDLVLKQQQIELLIASLPGLNSSEAQQVQRMKELEGQLEELEGERVRAVKEREELVKLVEGRIVGVGRMR
jgi:mediator of RNA polymerase II transcription subunit 21